MYLVILYQACIVSVKWTLIPIRNQLFSHKTICGTIACMDLECQAIQYCNLKGSQLKQSVNKFLLQHLQCIFPVLQILTSEQRYQNGTSLISPCPVTKVQGFFSSRVLQTSSYGQKRNMFKHQNHRELLWQHSKSTVRTEIAEKKHIYTLMPLLTLAC